MTTVETFLKMVTWVLEHTDTKNPTEVARAAGLNPVSMSKIRNGRTKKVKQETLRAVNAAYGNVFNPDWLRGESDVMLMADVPVASTGGTADVMPGNAALSGYTSGYAEYSSLVNAALAAKDEAIMALKRELAAKDSLISSLQQQLGQQAKDSRTKGDYRYSHGVAEQDA